MPRIIKPALFIGIPSIAGYYSGRYIGGSGFRAQSEDEMASLLINAVPDASLARLIDGNTENQSMFSSVVKTTMPQKSGDKSISYAYCGQKSVGFPTMAHGGLSATLMKQQFEKEGSLTIRYMKPTFIEQVLRLETVDTKDGQQVSIFPLHGSKPLATGQYVRKSWLSWSPWTN